MSEVTSGKNLTVIVLDEVEAAELLDLLNHTPILPDWPRLDELAEALEVSA
jgi:hypothetical protein